MVGRREKGIVSCCTSLIPKYKFCCTSQRRPPQCFVSPCGCLIGRRLCEWTIAECLSRQPRREKRGNVRTHSPWSRDLQVNNWLLEYYEDFVYYRKRLNVILVRVGSRRSYINTRYFSIFIHSRDIPINPPVPIFAIHRIMFLQLEAKGMTARTI